MKSDKEEKKGRERQKSQLVRRSNSKKGSGFGTLERAAIM